MIRRIEFSRNLLKNIFVHFSWFALLLPILPNCPAVSQENVKTQAEQPITVDQNQLKNQLDRSGDNRGELELAIRSAPKGHQTAIEFLIANMPASDLKTLSSEFLLNNVRLAYLAKEKAPWQIPDAIFFNDVLPYANIDEPRDQWRQEFFDLCWPIVKDCKTSAEAAQKLNEAVFQKVGVKYSTKRKRANQSPQESMEQGLASCTGLSIILADSCRSVGVPARLVGIPSWKNKNGNHTWIEIWDQQWHFTGAAEPSDKGLNHTWFQNDAALADPNSKKHSIYAASFRQTDLSFPMVWSPETKVFAENVTQRYITLTKPEPEPEPDSGSGSVNVMIRIWNLDRSVRLATDIQIFQSGDDESKVGKLVGSGTSRNDSADMNDILIMKLRPNSKYRWQTKMDDVTTQGMLSTSEEANQVIELSLPVPMPQDQKKNHDSDPEKTDIDSRDSDSQTLLSEVDQRKIEAVARHCFSDNPNADELTQEQLAAADEVLKTQPQQVRQLVWAAYKKSPLGQSRKSDFETNQVTFEEHLSPYTVKNVGERPENGWPLFIAMHGGGGAPQKLNDSQWKHMQVYYKDQPDVTGYKYLALRAPNNSWNGFYDDYVYPLIENLIQQFLVFGDVDPDKIFIMGYSHGGYGAFAIGPKIPYRFAAIHSSAAAPTDGQTSAKTLRNTRFTFMVGEKDTAYGRRERCEKFAEQIAKIKAGDDVTTDEYPVEFLFQPGFGHGGLPDREMIASMYDHKRNATPKHLTWELTDSVVKKFWWLSVDQPAPGKLIDAKIVDNIIDVKFEDLESKDKLASADEKQFTLHLDRRLIDPAKPISVRFRGATERFAYTPSVATLCKSVAQTGDIELAYGFEVSF